MIQLKPDADCAITAYNVAIGISFARIPDKDVVDDVYSLDKQSGILLDESVTSFSENVYESSLSKLERQRLYYHLSIPPVFDPMTLARVIACHLEENHGLSVKVIDDRIDIDPHKVTIRK